jgi:hypothetical protein
LKKHHGWCNGVNPLKGLWDTDENVNKCDWCGGDKGLHKNYPSENKTEDQLQKEYFPNVKRIS